MATLHPLPAALEPPPRFTYPFCYTPHPLALVAAEGVQRAIASCQHWREEADKGKMFGVLVVADGAGRLSYLAAYSGLLCGRNDWEWFVPPVYDLLRPDGYFKAEEARIVHLGEQLSALENGEQRKVLLSQLNTYKKESTQEIERYKMKMDEAKRRRDALRLATLDEAAEAALIRESQFMKAELRRMKKAMAGRGQALQAQLGQVEGAAEALRRERRGRSEALQQWLFRQFKVLNARGEERDLADIFAHTPSRVPPSGAGECCAPKLLQHAYKHGLKPLCMAEFWWGASPKAELRRHLHYYPACRGKCLPILGHMLQGLDVDPNPLEGVGGDGLSVFFEDATLLVVGKPAGMQSVPGRTEAPSVLSIVRERCPDATGPMMVHRLDMATSGLMVVAKTEAAYVALQRQFSERTIRKRYVALVSPCPTVAAEGTISLPLRPDPLDRPRQVVDAEGGKEAVTHYRITHCDRERGVARVALAPHTGRTHQLRVHCAHPAGLDAPIVGDALYGKPAGRLMLHAEAIGFRHPVTGETMEFEWPAGF